MPRLVEQNFHMEDLQLCKNNCADADVPILNKENFHMVDLRLLAK